VIDRCQTYGLNMEIEKHKRDWIVTISKRNDRTFTAPADARSPILRRAVLQAACQAHFQYDGRLLNAPLRPSTTCPEYPFSSLLAHRHSGCRLLTAIVPDAPKRFDPWGIQTSTNSAGIETPTNSARIQEN
jgi:hypothetical protein